MKKLTISRRIIFALFAVLFSVNLWGQTITGLTGSGTSESPWQISSAADWDIFAGWINNEEHASEYYKLMTNIPTQTEIDNGTVGVTTMVGTDELSFYGVFDGNGKTITVNYTGVNYMAPFYDTYDANIHSLNVTGNIVASAGSSAGLIGVNYGTTTITNVTVSVNIKNSENGSAGDNCAGFAIDNQYYNPDDGVLNFSNCVFNGTIKAGDNSGGFCATMSSGTATFTDCIFAPAYGSSIASGATFATNSTSWTGCYYTEQTGTTSLTAQGRLAYVYESIPDNTFVKKVTAHDITVYGKIDISGIEGSYLFNGSDYYPVIKSAVTLDDNDITSSDTTFTITKNETIVNEVVEKGSYTLTIAGNNANYPKSFNYTFDIVEDLTGGGTSENPFHIRSSADWLIFSNHVNNGDTYTDSEKTEHPYSEAYYRLTNDITTSVMVGTSSHPFSGNFNGRIGNTYGAYTLTFNCGSSYYDATSEEIVAPFRYTDGATITSLIIEGAIHTKAGKEAGLIGVNTYSHTSRVTTVEYIINYMNLYCYEELWDAQGGGLAYDGSYVHFSYSSHEGIVSASNYHGGICGIANSSTTFTRCLFDPAEGSMFWAENFAYEHPTNPDLNYSTCYYTVGYNQEESEQGVRVFVNDVPGGSIGHKITTFHEKQIYVSVPVVISGANKRYIYNNGEELLNISDVGVTINEIDAIANNLCSKVITNSSSDVVTSVRDKGTYTLTITAPKEGVESDYKGTVTMLIRVVESSSIGWAGLQTALSTVSAEPIIVDLPYNITAGENDVCLVVESGTVTINLNNKTINRNFNIDDAENATVGGHVLKVLKDATVIINGPGKITGGYNKAASNTEHAENSDGGGIFNMGNLTLNNVTIEYNKCEKYSTGISRTARGGGIYSGKNSTLIINNCTITHNEAKGGGGGIYAEQAAVFMMDNTIVRSNKSQDKGGGVRVDATNTKHYVADGKALADGALLKDCPISSNTVVFHSLQSASNGGGIHLDAGTLNLTGCTINNNNSSKYGGGIYMMGGTVNADNCSILYNKSYDSSDKFEGYGGGVCVLNGTYNMNGGRVYENSSYKQDGGGIFVAAGKTLNISGNVDITANWTDEESLSSRHTSNVYLVGSNDKIHITGSIEGSTIGVAKSGTTGRFTQNLNGNGTTNNFISDNTNYEILPDSGEAKIGAPSPVTPPTTETWNITDAVILTSTVSNDVKYITFGENGRLYVNTGGSIGNGTQITNNDPNKLVINGGQVYTTTAGVNATMLKGINYATTSGDPDNWYLISSSVATPSILENTNLVVLNGNNYPLYDLYRFNEAATATNGQGQLLQWENYRAHSTGEGANFTTLENGRGYLYRNTNNYTITIQGALNAAGFDYSLSFSGTNELKGFHIIGNPYSHDIYKGVAGSAIPNGSLLEDKYCVLNPNGSTWDLTNDGTAIPPMTGILVQAKAAGTLVMANSTDGDVAPSSKSAENNNIWFTIANDKYEDRACVEFRDGHGLNKIAHFNEEAPMLYVHHGDEDFASADVNPETDVIDLNFEAKTMGRYTLSVKPQGEFGYLHLIDKVTGEDVDMLLEKEFSFIGMPSDSKDRFVVRLSETVTDDNGNVIFAYQNGNDIVVSGEGELQVFDMMGRMVARQHVGGVETIKRPSSAGVYILRLNEMSQKIVVK